MTDPFEIVVPDYGAVFTETIVDPENVAILEGDPRARRLTRKELKQIAKQLRDYEAVLTEFQYDAQMEYHERLKKAFYDAKADRLNHEKGTDEYRYNDALMKAINSEAAEIRQKLEPVRRTALMRHRHRSRLEEHQIAIENMRLYPQLQQDMASEVQYFMRQIILRWSALGFREEIHKKGKTHIIRPRIEEVYVTEDEIQFKILVSKITLLGSSNHYLPRDVRGADLVSPETLAELSAACERPVTSPHTPEEYGGQGKDFSNGLWVVVHRLDMNSGLFKRIPYPTVLAKYNAAERYRYPVPFGVGRGRKINVCFLDEHPHIFIDGQTGSGKTNAIRQSLCTLVQKHSPDELRLVLTDMKASGDFTPFADIPHLITGEGYDHIIKQPTELEYVLEQIVKLMRKRMLLIGQLTVDIAKYNERVPVEQQLPRIVIVIDEYAGTRMDKAAKTRIDRYCIMLSTQARAAGIHLVIGSQQPYGDIVPKEVKANITFKLSGRQMTGGGSMSATGSWQAKRLERTPGRMICDDGMGIRVVQIPFASDHDVFEAAKLARTLFRAPQHDIWLLDDTEEVIPIRNVFGETMVIDLALSEFSGSLAGRNIWEHLRTHGVMDVSLERVLGTVKQIVSRKVVEHRGTTYTLTKPGNRYVLVPETSQLQDFRSVSIHEVDREVAHEVETAQQYPGWRTIENQEAATV